LWGILILVLFATLYSSAAILYRRGHLGRALTTGLLAIGLTYLAGLSIGLAYLPAAVTTISALILIVTGRFHRNTL
jgi:hypothetical protein